MKTVQSFSSLSVYQACPKLYDYKYEQGIDLDDYTLAARYGTWMIHWPITNWYACGGKFSPSFDQLWDQCEATEADLTPKKGRKNPYTIENARFLWNEYTGRFKRDFDEFDILSTEEYMVVGNYGARGDVVFRRRADGVVIPNDLKSSRWDAALDGAHRNNQFLGQMHVWGTTEAMVTLINVETLTIERISVSVLQDDVDQWVREKEFRVGQIEASRAASCWPRNAPQACRPYNRDCPMKEVCFG